MVEFDPKPLNNALSLFSVHRRFENCVRESTLGHIEIVNHFKIAPPDWQNKAIKIVGNMVWSDRILSAVSSAPTLGLKNSLGLLESLKNIKAGLLGLVAFGVYKLIGAAKADGQGNQLS